MINRGIVKSSFEPEQVTYIGDNVLVASDITSYTEIDSEGYNISGYQYNLIQYTKDEYLQLALAKIATLEDELAATKIILGVE